MLTRLNILLANDEIVIDIARVFPKNINPSAPSRDSWISHHSACCLVYGSNLVSHQSLISFWTWGGTSVGLLCLFKQRINSMWMKYISWHLIFHFSGQRFSMCGLRVPETLSGKSEYVFSNIVSIKI